VLAASLPGYDEGMGYELHITRAEEWRQSKLNPISLDQWLAYISSDPEMRLDQCATATTPVGDTLNYQSQGLAEWTEYSRNGKDGNFAWFDWQNGEVVVKNPDEELIGKMCRIAQALHARVQGDDGKFYNQK
jgi:hypothetical protein